jgi:hypothetical protein
MVPTPIAEGSGQVRMRDGARLSLLTLGAGIALLATAAAGNAPAALAAPQARLDPALIRASTGPE